MDSAAFVARYGQRFNFATVQSVAHNDPGKVLADVRAGRVSAADARKVAALGVVSGPVTPRTFDAIDRATR